MRNVLVGVILAICSCSDATTTRPDAAGAGDASVGVHSDANLDGARASDSSTLDTSITVDARMDSPADVRGVDTGPTNDTAIIDARSARDIRLPSRTDAGAFGGCASDAGVGEAGAIVLAANTWVELPSTYVLPPSAGYHSPMGWNTLLYDCLGRRMLVWDRWYDSVRLGSIYANAVLAYDPVARSASVLKLSNWTVGTGGTLELPANATDPTPVDRHPYRGVAFVPHQNAIYLTNGANSSAPRMHDSAEDTWRFDLTSGAWTRVASTRHPPNVLDDCMAYDASVNKIIYVAHDSATATYLWTMDPDAGQWNLVPVSGPAPARQGGCTLTYDPVRRRTVMYGGYYNYGVPVSNAWAFDARTNTWTQLTSAPVPAYTPGLAYNSRHDVFLVNVAEMSEGSWPAVPSRMFVYDPVENAWTEIAAPAGTRWPQIRNATVAYDPLNDVLIALAGSSGDPKWYAFRYVP